LEIRNEAQKYFYTDTSNKDYIFKEIVFKEVYPLYGQIDIKGSSKLDCKEDLKNQLNVLSEIFENLEAKSTLPLLEQRKFEMQSEELQELKADTEQIQNYIQKEIHPILSNSKIEGACQLLINIFSKLRSKTVLSSTEKFDAAISLIKKWLPF
jgi:hypothetical protein